MVVFQLSAVHSLRICEDLVSSKSFGVALAQIAEPGDKVVVVGDYETANSINFYAPVQLLVCEGGAASLGPGLGYPDAPRLVVTIEEVRALWRSGERAYVLGDEKAFTMLNIESNTTITTSAGRILATNQPVASR